MVGAAGDALSVVVVAVTAGDPVIMLMEPIPATTRALERSGRTIADLGLEQLGARATRVRRGDVDLVLRHLLEERLRQRNNSSLRGVIGAHAAAAGKARGARHV